MPSGKRPVIHRDSTFERDGRTYSVTQGGPDWGYAIHDERGRVVADNLFTLNEVRDYVEQGFLDSADASDEEQHGR